LPKTYQQKHIKVLLGKLADDVINMRIIKDKKGANLGFAFICFKRKSAAELAVKELDKKKVQIKTGSTELKVEFKKGTIRK